SMLISLGGKRTRMGATRGSVPELGPFALADLAQGLARFNRLAAKVPLEAPWRFEDADRADSETFATWIRRNLRTPSGRASFRIASESVFAADASDFSLLHALFYAHSGADLETLLSVDRGAQQTRFIDGAFHLAEVLADGLEGTITLSDPVRRIEHDDHGVTV